MMDADEAAAASGARIEELTAQSRIEQARWTLLAERLALQDAYIADLQDFIREQQVLLRQICAEISQLKDQR